MGAALLVGMVLARQKKFTAHAVCQSAVVLLNLIPIFFFMAPVFHRGVQPRLFERLSQPFYSVSAAHALLGTIAEIFALYILLTGWKLLPAVLRFDNYKRFMRVGLGLWWLTITLGLATYYVWYIAKPSTTTAQTQVAQQNANANANNAGPAAQATPKTVVVEMTSNEFKPKELKIEVGTTVVWKNASGSHNVIADDSGYESPIMQPGEEYKRTFDKEGTYKYYCAIHGEMDGKGMSGVIIVTK